MADQETTSSSPVPSLTWGRSETTRRGKHKKTKKRRKEGCFWPKLKGKMRPAQTRAKVEGKKQF
jgi:hypothetical protein